MRLLHKWYINNKKYTPIYIYIQNIWYMFQRLSLDQFSWYFNSKPHLRPKIWTRSPLVPVPLAFCNISSTITKRRACESSTSMAMVKAVSGEMCGNKTSAWQRELCWCPWQSKNVLCHDISWYNDIMIYIYISMHCGSICIPFFILPILPNIWRSKTR